MKKTLQEIADIVGGRIAGAAAVEIEGLDNIDGAGSSDLTFAVEPHIEKAKTCKAAAVMLPEGTTDFPKTALYVEDPRAAFAKLLSIFTPKLERVVEVSDKAHIGKCRVGEDHKRRHALLFRELRSDRLKGVEQLRINSSQLSFRSS